MARSAEDRRRTHASGTCGHHRRVVVNDGHDPIQDRAHGGEVDVLAVPLDHMLGEQRLAVRGPR